MEERSGVQIADPENATKINVTSLTRHHDFQQPIIARRPNAIYSTQRLANAPIQLPESPPVKPIGHDDRIETSTTPHSVGQTRDTTIPFFKRDGPHIPEYSNSIVDDILKRFGRGKPNISPDAFENFLRSKREITLADVYRSVSDKPASNFGGLFAFRVLRRGTIQHPVASDGTKLLRFFGFRGKGPATASSGTRSSEPERNFV